MILVRRCPGSLLREWSTVVWNHRRMAAHIHSFSRCRPGGGGGGVKKKKKLWWILGKCPHPGISLSESPAAGGPIQGRRLQGSPAPCRFWAPPGWDVLRRKAEQAERARRVREWREAEAAREAAQAAPAGEAPPEPPKEPPKKLMEKPAEPARAGETLAKEEPTAKEEPVVGEAKVCACLPPMVHIAILCV